MKSESANNSYRHNLSCLAEAIISSMRHISQRQSIQKSNPCDHGIWPMTLKFNRFLAVVEVHVHVQFQEAQLILHHHY